MFEISARDLNISLNRARLKGLDQKSWNMAAVRGFSLDKLAKIRMSFSVFDREATSTRCAAYSDARGLAASVFMVLAMFLSGNIEPT